uniref:Uncharacterized protein n=3 Tax=Borrelia turicatae TaxID=142 RepID=S4VQM9_BORT9|nr:hypothetical protein BTA066 [Borrelia turicatae 91E135]
MQENINRSCMMSGLGLAMTSSIIRYSRPMFLFKRNLIKNITNASYEKKTLRETPINFDGVFLFKDEDTVELFDSNIFIKEMHAKVYTLDTIDFSLEDQVLVDEDLMEIVGVNKYCVYLKTGYTVLILKKL